MVFGPRSRSMALRVARDGRERPPLTATLHGHRRAGVAEAGRRPARTLAHAATPDAENVVPTVVKASLMTLKRSSLLSTLVGLVWTAVVIMAG